MEVAFFSSLIHLNDLDKFLSTCCVLGEFNWRCWNTRASAVENFCYVGYQDKKGYLITCPNSHIDIRKKKQNLILNDISSIYY